MSKNVQSPQSTEIPVDDDEALINRIRKKDDEKFIKDQLQLHKLNHQVENSLNEEKRRVINEICYLRWFEKKSNELIEKNRLKLEDEKLKQEAEILIKQNQAESKLKYNEWLLKKQAEAKIKHEQMMVIKRKKDEKNEQKKIEKQHAEKVWKMWIANKTKKDKEARRKKSEEEEQRKREKEVKRKTSEKKFKEWLKHSSTRPRPVRSNLGFASLSCTNIGFVNPIPWKSVIEEENANDSSKMLTVLYKKPSNIGLYTEKSSMTLQLDENCYSFRRTADWVNVTSQQVLQKSGKIKSNSDTLSMSDSSKGTVIKFSRNRSAPEFVETDTNTVILENDENMKKDF